MDRMQKSFPLVAPLFWKKKVGGEGMDFRRNICFPIISNFGRESNISKTNVHSIFMLLWNEKK